jgi:uncharacterized protein
MIWRRTLLRAGFAASLAVACYAAGNDPRLIQAAKNGDSSAVASLLKQKVDPNSAEADGTTSLHYAVRADDLDTTDKLLRAGADAKIRNRYGITPLHLACLNGNPEMIERLLKAGADANEVSTEGETALMTASRTGKLDAVKVLLAHGANVNAREEWRGQTALMWAVAQHHADVARELIAKGADVNARSAFQKWERQVTAEPREKWMPAGALTPLQFAARQDCLECVKILLDSGADINVTDENGIPAITTAIINGHYDFAAYLAERGANVNAADRVGRTPLYSAVDFHSMPDSNRPAPKVDQNHVSNFELIQLLIAKGADVNARLKAQQPYRTKLDRGDDTMLTTGTTPLLRAAKAGDAVVMKLLIEKGADVNLGTTPAGGRLDLYGITPLMAAAGVGTKEEDNTGRRKTEQEAIDSIELCLKAGADINAADSRGQTALHGAAIKGWSKVVQHLAGKGAKLDVKDKRGFTPLDAALGKAGGLGFDGAAGVVHDDTAKLLQRLMAGPAAAKSGN